MSTTSKYYPASDAYIYPSSNSNDGGEVNSEENLRMITDKLTFKNFVVRRTGNEMTISKLDSKTLHISEGECSIEGYYIKLNQIDYSVSSLVKNKTYHAIVQLLKDSSAHVRGDGTNIDTRVYECRGVQFDAVTEIDETIPYVELGTFTIDNNGDITDVTPDPYRFTWISSYSIIMEGDPEHRDLQTWLEDYINALKEYLDGSFIYNSSNSDNPQGASVTQTVNTKLHFLQDVEVGTESEPKNFILHGPFTATRVTGDNIKFNTKLEGPNNFYVDSNGDLHTGGKVYDAVWNDLAEWYEKVNPEVNYEPGTVICKVPKENLYTTSKWYLRRLVVGVCSDTYGTILGGENLRNMENNNYKYIPVALSGRVKVKVCEHHVIHEGDLLYVSLEEGRATNQPPTKEEGCVIGKSLEESDGSKDRILMQVMMR